MKVNPPRFLVLITAAFFIIIFFGALAYYKSSLPPSIAINAKGQPTIGYTKAKVHVVVFEEPKCSNCRDFNKQIFPMIKDEFIDTNKIRYTVIPVSFLPGSMPAAVSLLCVYLADPRYPNNDLFFTYIDYLFNHQPEEHTDWATADKLMKIAKAASPAINLPKLNQCIEMEKHRVQIQKNTVYGQSIMGGVISTPTVYVNGIEAKNLTVDGLRKLIKQVLNQQGVN